MEKDVVVAYVGSVVPDKPEFLNRAFSRAGNMSQVNLLVSMANAGLKPSLTLSQRPVPAFPRFSRVVFPKSRVNLTEEIVLTLMPMVNLPVVRQMTIGLVVILSLVRWGLQNRGARRVVYIFNLSEPSGIFAWLGTRLIRARMVAFVNDINIPGSTVPKTWLRRFDYVLQKWLMPRLDGVIAVNKDIVKDFAPCRPFLLVEGGVQARFAAERAESVGDHGKPFTIVSTGTLYDTNGIRELVDGFRLIRGGDFRLIIAGKGPLESYVRAAADQDARIQFLGYLTFEEVLALYQTADLLVSMRPTNRLDTRYFFPSKLMEYLASGTPVLSTCTGHVKECFGEYVYLLEEESPRSLADTLLRIASLTPTERKNKGAAAREFIMTTRSWEVQGRRVAAFLREIAGVSVVG